MEVGWRVDRKQLPPSHTFSLARLVRTGSRSCPQLCHTICWPALDSVGIPTGYALPKNSRIIWSGQAFYGDCRIMLNSISYSESLLTSFVKLLSVDFQLIVFRNSLSLHLDKLFEWGSSLYSLQSVLMTCETPVQFDFRWVKRGGKKHVRGPKLKHILVVFHVSRREHFRFKFS